jgi:ATP-binding cassette, subfamily B, bacterial PglK
MVVMIAIAALLVAVNPWLALSVAFVLLGLYSTIFFGVKRFLETLGKRRLLANTERYTTTSEVLGGIKVLKVLGVEDAYIQRFRAPSLRYSRAHVLAETISMLPQYVVELLLFGGVVLMTLVLLQLGGGVDGNALGSMLPLIGLYAFAAARLKPAAQNAFKGLASVRLARPALRQLRDDLSLGGVDGPVDGTITTGLPIARSIVFSGLVYCYPGAATPALLDIHLVIPRGSRLGIVGSTGAGKTTLVDVLLGLLRPTAGQIEVDGQPVTKALLRRWQRSIGYVPQDIFLADDTVAANIALGVAKPDIDLDRVERCARLAQLHDFVISELERGYLAQVGERGVRLSGGQRQRIGIARALYRDPEVLIFDEATSALDNVTERAVLSAIDNVGSDKTVIMIAHRLSTVRDCDQILLLDRGRMVGLGTYDELLSGNQAFQHLVGT